MLVRGFTRTEGTSSSSTQLLQPDPDRGEQLPPRAVGAEGQAPAPSGLSGGCPRGHRVPLALLLPCFCSLKPGSHSPERAMSPWKHRCLFVCFVSVVFSVIWFHSPLTLSFLGFFLVVGRKEGSPDSDVCLFCPGRCSLGCAPGADKLAGNRRVEHGRAWERPGPRSPR